MLIKTSIGFSLPDETEYPIKTPNL